MAYTLEMHMLITDNYTQIPMLKRSRKSLPLKCYYYTSSLHADIHPTSYVYYYTLQIAYMLGVVIHVYYYTFSLHGMHILITRP